MRTAAAVPLERCCAVHDDWAGLARHLVIDFSSVPSRTLVDELWHAQSASRFFGLDLADALHCAELMVRYRVLVATGGHPSPALPLSAKR
jgi:hypothetical protein